MIFIPLLFYSILNNILFTWSLPELCAEKIRPSPGGTHYQWKVSARPSQEWCYGNFFFLLLSGARHVNSNVNFGKTQVKHGLFNFFIFFSAFFNMFPCISHISILAKKKRQEQVTYHFIGWPSQSSQNSPSFSVSMYLLKCLRTLSVTRGK